MLAMSSARTLSSTGPCAYRRGRMEPSIGDVLKLLAEQRVGVLCTAQPDGAPYTSLVAIAASEDLTQVAFATLRATRKFANLSSEPRVALLLDDRTNQPSDLLDASAVTLQGSARELAGDERARWNTALMAKHCKLTDFLRAPDCAVVAIDVVRVLLVTRFQRVTELVVRGGVLQRVTAEAR
jgi:nitroimidazol reductase NimA-like FMN-containing flavoprotein (pyridoxamine 5'-phosphate oxidase superfamily)